MAQQVSFNFSDICDIGSSVYMYQNSPDSWISGPFWTLTLDPCPSGEPLCTGNVKPRPQDTQIKSRPQAAHLQTQTTGGTLHT